MTTPMRFDTQTGQWVPAVPLKMQPERRLTPGWIVAIVIGCVLLGVCALCGVSAIIGSVTSHPKQSSSDNGVVWDTSGPNPSWSWTPPDTSSAPIVTTPAKTSFQQRDPHGYAFCKMWPNIVIGTATDAEMRRAAFDLNLATTPELRAVMDLLVDKTQTLTERAIKITQACANAEAS